MPSRPAQVQHYLDAVRTLSCPDNRQESCCMVSVSARSPKHRSHSPHSRPWCRFPDMYRSLKTRRPIHVAVLECEQLPSAIVRSRGNFTAIFDSWLRVGARKLNATRKLDQHVTITTSRWSTQDCCHPADLDSVDALLVTGSVSSAYDDIPWIETLQRFLNGELCVCDWP